MPKTRFTIFNMICVLTIAAMGVATWVARSELRPLRSEVQTLREELGTALPAKPEGRLPIIDSVVALRAAMEEQCIIFLCHSFATDDVLFRQKLESKFHHDGKLGRYKIYILEPSDPTVDNGVSDRMHALMEQLCQEKGVPKFHWFHNPSGMFFWKIGPNVQWKLGISSIEDLMTQTDKIAQNAG